MQAPRRLQLRRGNTAAISTYVGAPGELIVDTTTNTLYLHNGVTVGGTATTVDAAGITSNISSLQGNITTLTANAGVQASNIASLTSSITGANAAIVTANTNMKGYVDAANTIQTNQITTISSSVTGANAAIVTANTALKGYVDGQITTVSNSVAGANAAIVAANTALKGYVDGQITSLVGGAPAILDTLNEIATALGNDANLSVTLTNSISTANTAMKGYVDSAITTVSSSVTGANAAIVTANTSMKGYVDSVANNTSYSNANVASYLPTYSGNIAGNIAKNGYTWTFGTDGTLTLPGTVTFPDATIQSTAWTGSSSTLTDGVFTIDSFQVSTQIETWTAGATNMSPTDSISFFGHSSKLFDTSWTMSGSGITGQSAITAIDPIMSGMSITGYTVTIAQTISAGLVTGDYVFSNPPSTQGVNITSDLSTWIFGSNGTLTLPADIASHSWIEPAGNTLSLYKRTGNASSHVTQTAIKWESIVLDQDTGNWPAYAAIYAELPTIDTPAVSISARQGTSGNTSQWVFGADGKLVLSEIGTLSNGGYDWTFGTDGTTTLPAGGTITEGVVTSNPTIQLTPATPTVASQKLVIKGGGSYSFTTNGININYYVNTGTSGDTLTFYVYSNTYSDQTLYWWIYPVGVGITTPDSGTVVLSGAGGNFSVGIDSDAYEFTVRVSPEADNYNAGSIGVESGLINADAPPFTSEHHLHLTTGNLTETSIFLGTDDHNVRTTTAGNIQITTPNTTNKVWEFGTDGNLTLPSDGYLRITSGITTTGASPAPIISGFTITNSQGISGNGNVTTTQYVNAGYFTGNGALLTGIVAGAGTTYSNANVATYLTNYDGDINFTSSVAIISNVDVITVLDSIRSPSYQYSNGVSILSGLGYGNTEVASYLPTYTGNIGNVKTTANVITSGYFVGNGALLTGIVAGTTYSNSNVASYLPTYSGNIANLTVTNTLRLTATKIALGYLSGLGGAGQGTNSVAVGSYSGYNTQGNSAVAIGVNAGMTQGDDTVAIGSNAGGSQTTQAVAVGFGAGQSSQSMGGVALGYASGQTAQGLRAVAIGSVAGNDHQGAQSIAIGHNSGYSYQPANSIELNATGTALDYTALTAGLYITSVKNDTANVTNVMYYNTTSKEVTYGPASGGSSNSFANIAVSGQTTVVADSSTDTLTLVAGSGISITTDAGADSVTITATGGGTSTVGFEQTFLLMGA